MGPGRPRKKGRPRRGPGPSLFQRVKLEVRAGFEPANNGFADHPLRPLGYRTEIGFVESNSIKLFRLPEARL